MANIGILFYSVSFSVSVQNHPDYRSIILMLFINYSKFDIMFSRRKTHPGKLPAKAGIPASSLSLLIWLGLIALSAQLTAQRQYADTLYRPPGFDPAFPDGKGPVVMIDEAHHNFHTRSGRYRPFATILEMDGCPVRSSGEEFSMNSLRECDILVIANALPETSVQHWIAPTASAFTPEEIQVLHRWVGRGGSLFLLADHMPMGGAAKELAAAFGFTFYDSFAGNSKTQTNTELFIKADSTLSGNILTTVSAGYYDVDSVATFTGQAFEIPPQAHSILNCGEGWISYLPDTAWRFNEQTKVLDSNGWSQGAYLQYKKGKVVVFGEAAMFSAQIAEIDDHVIKAGMNNPLRGKYNYRLLLNIIRWLGS